MGHDRVMADWSLLRQMLAEVDDRLTVRWDDLDQLVGGLPRSAYEHAAYWKGDRSGWPGFTTTDVQVGASVTFVRRDARSAVARRASATPAQRPDDTPGSPDGVLVGCVKSKLDHPAPARDLYTSALFRKARAHAEATGGPWFVLSAEHGLHLPNIVDVASDSLDGALRKPSVPWSGGGSKQEGSVLRCGTKTNFADKCESQDLLSDEYQILVMKRNRHLRRGRTCTLGEGGSRSACRIAGRGKAQVDAVGALQVAQHQRGPRPRNTHMARRKIGVFRDDDLALEPADVDEIAEGITRAIGAALGDDDQVPASGRRDRGNGSACVRSGGRGVRRGWRADDPRRGLLRGHHGGRGCNGARHGGPRSLRGRERWGHVRPEIVADGVRPGRAGAAAATSTGGPRVARH